MARKNRRRHRPNGQWPPQNAYYFELDMHVHPWPAQALASPEAFAQAVEDFVEDLVCPAPVDGPTAKRPPSQRRGGRRGQSEGKPNRRYKNGKRH